MKEKYYKSNLFKKDYTFLKNKIFESFITSDEQEEDDSVVEQEVSEQTDSVVGEGDSGEGEGDSGEGEGDSGEGEGDSVEGEGDSVEGEGDSVEGEDDSVEGEDDSVEGEDDSGEGEGDSVEGEGESVEGGETETINRVIVSKNINEENKQIYDYTIKEFYYNFINSTVEITKSIKDSMSNSNLTQAELKPSLIDVLLNKKNLINVGIMLILISIFLSPLLL